MNMNNRRSIRLQGYDYSQPGLYYLTLSTRDRLCIFGEIRNNEMVLNDIGHHAEKCWLQIPTHFPNTVLHEYIIMPNHLHGIVEIVGANHYLPDENRASNLRAKDVSALRVGTERSLLRSYKTRICNNFQSMFPQAQHDRKYKGGFAHAPVRYGRINRP